MPAEPEQTFMNDPQRAMRTQPAPQVIIARHVEGFVKPADAPEIASSYRHGGETSRYASVVQKELLRETRFQDVRQVSKFLPAHNLPAGINHGCLAE